MAVDRKTVDFLKRFPSRGRFLMLGRQHDCTKKVEWRKRTFAEPILAGLGFSAVHSMDASPAESPTFVHDLNKPVDESLHGQYDAILDGGTLEHVFNIAQALENVRVMLKPGGWFFTAQQTITGHGFYTLSPELFFGWGQVNGFGGFQCLGHYRWLPWLFSVRVEPYKRCELQTLIPFGFMCAMRKEADQKGCPRQADPNVTSGRLGYWFRDTNLAGRPEHLEWALDWVMQKAWGLLQRGSKS